MDIGIDLGTSNVLVYVKGRGVVINQPSVVAYEKSSKRIIAIGNKAKKMIGKTPESIEVVRPLVKGVGILRLMHRQMPAGHPSHRRRQHRYHSRKRL